MASSNDVAKTVEVDEVLPPDSPQPPPHERPNKGAKESLKRAFPRVIARLLDEFITLPNTKFKIGLDPIIGFFFPVVGDAITATLGTSILVEAVRRQMPKHVIIRMGTNIAINAALGSVLVVGDAFSVWFKSNAKNYALLEKHSGNPDQPLVKTGMWPFFLFMIGIVGIIALVVFGMFRVFRLCRQWPVSPIQ
jgi:hypothetical protein